MKLSETIYQLRTEHHMSQNDLADALEVSRQSVSKWETGAAVPDLDKLIRMSELFGITLDDLVRGVSPSSKLPTSPAHSCPPDPMPSDPPIETKINDIKSPLPATNNLCIAGWFLIAFGFLTLLFISLFGDLGSGLLLSIPFFLCGIICLCKKHHILLWCAWSVFLWLQTSLHFATSTTFFSISFLILSIRSGEFLLQALFTCVLFVVNCALLVWTLFSYRDQYRAPTRRHLIEDGILLIMLLLFRLPIFLMVFPTLPYYIQTTLIGLLYDVTQVLFAMLLVHIAALLRHHTITKQKKTP